MGRDERIEALEEMVRDLIDNIESGSYESTGQCVAAARALLGAPPPMDPTLEIDEI